MKSIKRIFTTLFRRVTKINTTINHKNNTVNDNSSQVSDNGINANQYDLIDANAKLGRFIVSNKDKMRFNIAGDFQLFNRIVNDMRLNGGDLLPIGVWSEYSVNLSLDSDVQQNIQQDELYTTFSTRFSTLSQMLDPWVGQVGMQKVNIEQVKAYRVLLEKIDLCELTGDDLFTTAVKQNMLNTDLGSIMDVNLIANLIPFLPGEKYSILEIGGGYGRLAEALTNGVDNSLHYVLVDAVPGSLLYAKHYLEKAFPNKHIGFYLDDLYDDTYDFYILPPWHLNLISNTAFDLCINVESMQEMEQQHVDYYIALFDKLIKDSGHIYISNSRAYHFKGTWRFPDNWEMIMCHNTPRSWTNDHPTLMFKKTKENYRKRNYIIDGLYAQQVIDWNLKQENTILKNLVARRDEKLNKFRKFFRK